MTMTHYNKYPIKLLLHCRWLLILFVLYPSCVKDIETIGIAPYIPANLDVKAGAWKTFILSNSNAVIIQTPEANSSPAYLLEIENLKKNTLASLSEQQKIAIEYWGSSTVVRWNEIARELAAKYNLAPPANADATYPVPDASNPSKEPKFPFANPPYTARALAYLSVAQYDALVTTWNYKYKFNRLSPAKIDPTIKPSLPVTDLPSYPSEHAVIASTSYAILSVLFPVEKDYLKTKLEECKKIGLWAGTNVLSDLVEGENLGLAVASIVLDRAKNDGMSAANNQSLTASMIEAAKSRGIIEPWKSQESPIRPPMLPNYGSVKTWNFDRTVLENIRPGLPYIKGSSQFEKELNELKEIQKHQTREQARIANFWADGAGSYTPPAHWHRIAAEEAVNQKYSEVRIARTLALLGTTLMDAGIACWDTKYFYYTPRPQQFGVKTSVGLPNFPSYTSGHSTFSSAAATLLGYIFPFNAEKYNQYAHEASDSRVYGLIHYRVDCEMGLTHGKKIGEYAISRGKLDGSGL